MANFMGVEIQASSGAVQDRSAKFTHFASASRSRSVEDLQKSAKTRVAPAVLISKPKSAEDRR